MYPQRFYVTRQHNKYIFLSYGTVVDERFKVLIPRRELHRLNSTVFRGKEVRKAGNFCAWDAIVEMLQDPRIKSPLLNSLYFSSSRQVRAEINLEEPVGWTTTERSEFWQPEELEIRDLNKRAKGYFANVDDAEAPFTSIVTIVLSLRQVGDETHAILRTTYPGHDVGNLSKRGLIKGTVFFDWQTPGATDVYCNDDSFTAV